ncbi:MAG: hypothetical protein GWN56_03390 [Nitrosopumilaceae archaeon]|nr:hypothetical protein [Nitrosopumilaceae archaeon]
MRDVLLITITILLLLSFVKLNNAQDTPISCPEKCLESRKNCNLSCSQIVGGGAKSKERRECVNECGVGLEECNERCINPTPRPTQIPERYHDKPCVRGCELKATDCNEVCTKYTGGGAKSKKKAICRRDCREGLQNCKNWCVSPTPKPTPKPKPIESMSCPEVCRIKKLDCESGCSVYLGGGAKSEKRSQCNVECREFNEECLAACSQ